jgi:hypothetical protein
MSVCCVRVMILRRDCDVAFRYNQCVILFSHLMLIYGFVFNSAIAIKLQKCCGCSEISLMNVLHTYRLHIVYSPLIVFSC